MNRRRGYSLIELLVVMSTGTALMAVAIGLVHRTMTIHSHARTNDAVQHEALRLSRQLRTDLRQAADVTVDGDSFVVTFSTENQAPATYTVSNEQVVRLQATDSGQDRHETFALRGCEPARVELQASPRRLRLTVPLAGRMDGASPRTVLDVEAVIGRASSSAEGGQP